MATETASTGRESDKFMLRFPDGMRDRIAEEAKKNNRSMNAEVVARLEQSFAGYIDKDLTLSMLNAEVTRLTDELRAVRGADSQLMSKIAPTVEDHIRGVMEETGLSFEEALLLTVTRGSVLETAAPLVILQVAKGTPIEEARSLLMMLSEHVPADAGLSYEQTDIQKTRLLSSEVDKAALLEKSSKSPR